MPDLRPGGGFVTDTRVADPPTVRECGRLSRNFEGIRNLDIAAECLLANRMTTMTHERHIPVKEGL
jgi:hypothetical protein